MPDEEANPMRTQLYLTPKDAGRHLSLEEFEHADSQEGYRYELINGRLSVSPAPDLPHERFKNWFARLLWAYAGQHPEVINEVTNPARVFVPGRRRVTAPEPDIAAFHDFPTQSLPSQVRWQDVSPVLVVEVLSEDNAGKDLDRNLRLYLRVPSIKEYWVVDPREDADYPSLIVYRRRGTRWQRPITVAPGETYTTRLLPGFTLALPASEAEQE
jgi:Uma2 family endonuclease